MSTVCSVGKPCSEETKKKISEALMGNILSEETRRKMSKAHKGLHHSKETKRKISEAMKGNKNPAWKGDSASDTMYPSRARKIYQEYHKVTLIPEIDVHHIDGNVRNNEIFNLKAWWHPDHISYHMKKLIKRKRDERGRYTGA